MFFGCAYEFVKCYLAKPDPNDDDSNDSLDYEQGNNEENDEDEDKPYTTKQKWMLALCISGGILLQPLYLLFYILFAIMECYRRLPCWAIYAL